MDRRKHLQFQVSTEGPGTCPLRIRGEYYCVPNIKFCHFDHFLSVKFSGLNYVHIVV